MRTEKVRARKVAKALVLLGLVALSPLQPQGGLWAADDYPCTAKYIFLFIGMALVKSDFDFFGGGGFKDPDGKKSKAPQGNVLEAARSAGYTLVDNRRDFMALKSSPGLKVIAINP